MDGDGVPGCIMSGHAITLPAQNIRISSSFRPALNLCGWMPATVLKPKCARTSTHLLCFLFLSFFRPFPLSPTRRPTRPDRPTLFTKTKHIMARVILPYIAHCCCCIPLKPGTIFLAFILLVRAVIDCWDAVWSYSPLFPQLNGPEIFVYLFLDVALAVLAIAGVTAIARENTRVLHILSRILLAFSFLSLACAIVNIGLVRAQRDSYVSWCTTAVNQDPIMENNSASASNGSDQASAECWEFWNAALVGSVLGTVINWLINTYFALCLDSYRRHLEAEGLRRRDLPMSDVYPRPPSPNVAVPPPYHSSPKLAPHPLRPQADMPPAYPYGEGYKGEEEGKWV